MKNHINKDYEDSRSAFNSKMNQILDNFKTKTPHKEKQEFKIKQVEAASPTFQVKPQAQRYDQILPSKERGQSFSKEELKVVSVFENTTKVEERLKAILSYHW